MIETVNETPETYDVIVVGAGNAAFSAAHAARERDCRVLMLEKAPEEWAGGNSYFTVGGFRVVVDGLDALRPILDDIDDEKAANTELPPYSADEYMQDMVRQTKGRCDAVLTKVLVDESADVVRWLHGKGIRWTLMYEGQSFKVDGKSKFWGGFYLGAVDKGKGLIRQHIEGAARSGIEIRYATRVTRLLQDGAGRVTGVVVDGPDGEEEIRSSSVVLAAGGFEADPRKRAAYLGPGWDLAKVRGTPYNTGDGFDMAFELGAAPAGHWSGCHAVAWDANARAEGGDRELAYSLTKHMYPLGIVVNSRGQRFLDEGADFRGLTYAEYGGRILTQPGALAYQVFDGRTRPLLRADQYEGPGVTSVQADTIEDLAELMDVDASAFAVTIAEFNASTSEGHFDPAVKDGLTTDGIEPPKSNWALPLDTAPYYAFKVTCGITFTYGGLRIDDQCRVLDVQGKTIRGLYTAGEMVGGLFYHNYPGGTGLTSGAVFGRRAGYAAADSVAELRNSSS